MTHLPALSSFINFAVLMGLLIFLLRKPVTAFLQDRSQTLSKELTESEKLRAQAQAMLAQYQEKMNQLDAEVETILTKAKQDGQKLRDEILQQAQRQAAQTMENAKLAANNQADVMIENLQKEIMAAALAQASQKVAKKADTSDHQQYVNQFMEELQGGFDGRIR
jgi:F-type H+-transporting ATPase subunit b